MGTRLTLPGLALCGFALAFASPALGAAAVPDSGPGETRRGGAEANLPTDGRPIVATVVDVDEQGGRVTLSTEHGPVALSVSQDVAERLSPGDVVVLRLTDEDVDSPSASPREEPAAPAPGNKI